MTIITLNDITLTIVRRKHTNCSKNYKKNIKINDYNCYYFFKISDIVAVLILAVKKVMMMLHYTVDTIITTTVMKNFIARDVPYGPQHAQQKHAVVTGRKPGKNRHVIKKNNIRSSDVQASKNK